MDITNETDCFKERLLAENGSREQSSLGTIP